MARLVKREDLGVRTVVELTTDCHAYTSKTGVINHNCDECKRIHLMPDKITPRAWKLSEVSAGYHKKGENFPCMSDLHPHGRCTMVTILPGYGFDADGKVTYITHGYDILKEQRGE
jgi:hypothetical protein